MSKRCAAEGAIALGAARIHFCLPLTAAAYRAAVRYSHFTRGDLLRSALTCTTCPKSRGTRVLPRFISPAPARLRYCPPPPPHLPLYARHMPIEYAPAPQTHLFTLPVTLTRHHSARLLHRAYARAACAPSCVPPSPITISRRAMLLCRRCLIYRACRAPAAYCTVQLAQGMPSSRRALFLLLWYSVE